MADPSETVDNAQASVASSASDTKTNPTGEEEIKNSESLIVEGVQHFQQGKRHMIVGDYKSAVTSLEQACKLLDACYGTGAIECGEAYLQYGIALFELARLEEGIMDGVVKIDGQNLSATEEEEEESDQGDEEGPDEGPEEQAEVEESEESETKPTESVSKEKVDIDLTQQPSTSKGETFATNEDKSDEEEETDNATNVEIAWELLILAQDIFARSDPSKETILNLAETYQKLGEISIEWENNANAVEMLKECLEHRKTVLEPDDRLIAVAYHYLGIAFSFQCDYDNANSCFESALGVIELRITNLKQKLNVEKDQLEKDAIEQEIKQLEDLIPELRGKSEDMKEQMQSQFKTLDSLEKETEQEEIKQAKLQASPEKPVNNISHLIKRKINDTENISQNGSETNNKKVRTDVNNSTNDNNSTEAI